MISLDSVCYKMSGPCETLSGRAFNLGQVANDCKAAVTGGYHDTDVTIVDFTINVVWRSDLLLIPEVVYRDCNG